MKYSILVVSLCFFSISCFSQKEFEDIEEVHIYYRGLFGNQSNLPDELGNITIDTGSANTGRVELRITDVEISKEDRPEEPGCADVCPPRTIITFTCKKAPCVSDPALKSYVSESGSITAGAHKRGKKVYDFLVGYQNFVNSY